MYILFCSGNEIRSFTGMPSIVWLECADNGMESLDISGCNDLGALDCSGNRLALLDTGNCPELYTLLCKDNLLASLDISGNTKLSKFNCELNPGENNVMRIKAWFDSVNIPWGFEGTTGQYYYNGAAVRVEYWCE